MSRVEDRIVGNYVLRALIGKGATSEVYAAEHRLLGDVVALKLLRDELVGDEAAVAAFIAEAVRTREIEHPAVVRVLEVGRDDATGRCYLVMERIAGGSLAARLRDAGPLAEPSVRRLGAAIADGMQAAHARGIIHRDLKPGNIMLRGEDPVIIDFGIAKHLGQLAAVVTSRRVGTLAYMAPEQLTGGLISPAADVWALGVILFEAATGRLPFDNFADGRWPQLFDPAPRASSLAPVSPALDALLARCLATEPGARFASMAELAAALRAEPGEDPRSDRFIDRFTEDLGAMPPAPVAPAPNAPRARSRLRLGLLGGALALLVLVPVVAASSGTARLDEARAPLADAGQTTAEPLAADAAVPDADPLPELGAEERDIELEPALAEVLVRSTPRGAEVVVDGVARGLTPARVELELPAWIVVRRAGYRAARVRVEEPGTIIVPLQRVRRSVPRTSQGETLD